MVLSLAVQLSRIRGSITHHLAPYLAKFQLFSNLWLPYLAKFQLFSNLWLLKSVCAQTCATDLEIWISKQKKNCNIQKTLNPVDCVYMLYFVFCVAFQACVLSEYYTLYVFSVAISVCLCSSLGLALCCTENIVREFLWIQCVCLCSSLDLALCAAENIVC